jgi:predicted enzyme related to lactoylglutathione lyase
MKKVTALGGIFFKAKDAETLRAWYREHLGIESEGEGGFTFHWREAAQPEQIGQTVWSIFSGNTKYFEPSRAPFMINYRVENLDSVLEQLKAEGVEIDDRIEEYEYGRFAWIMDPEGNRIELWEPGVPFTKET